MSELNEDKLDDEIVIDFNQLRDPALKESFLSAFGHMVKRILGSIFGPNKAPSVMVRGKPKEIKSFATALNSEGAYLAAVQRYDLDHPRTHKNKAKLKRSVKKFERDTGIKWPFDV